MRVSASAPRSEAKASASGTSIPLASAYVRPGGEAVAGAVRVLVRPGRSGGLVGAAGLGPAPERAGGRDDELRRRLEIAGLIALGLVLSARDERVELDARRVQRRQLSGGRDEHARPARLAHRLGVAGREVDAVGRRRAPPTAASRRRPCGRGLSPITVIVRSPASST